MRLMVRARVRAVVVAAMATVGIGVLGGIAPPVTAATTAPVPAIFAVGSRLTWNSGDATLEGAKLVPDPDGWLWRDGQWYRVESTGGNGGVGYEQIDVLSNTGGSIVGDLRLFLNTDLQQNINVPAGTAVVVGTPDGIGDYWVPPARLAALQDGFDGTTRIVHGQLDRSVGTAFVGRQLATSATAAGVAPTTTPSDRAFGSAMFDGLWIPIDALAQLQPQQVLDQDPVTGQVVTFAGVENNAAAIVLSGPADQVTQYYDLTSGLLVASTDRRPVPGSGTQVISVQFTGQE